MHYVIYLQQLRNMGVPESEWQTSDDVSNPDPTTHQRRRAQLRHFDRFPYADVRTA